MQAKLIAVVAGHTTFENATTTINHIVQIGETFYMVELGANDDIRANPVPKSVKVLATSDLRIGDPLIDSFSQANVEAHEAAGEGS